LQQKYKLGTINQGKIIWSDSDKEDYCEWFIAWVYTTPDYNRSRTQVVKNVLHPSPQTPHSVLKLKSWNFAYRGFILIIKKLKTRLWNFVCGLRYESFSLRLSWASQVHQFVKWPWYARHCWWNSSNFLSAQSVEKHLYLSPQTIHPFGTFFYKG